MDGGATLDILHQILSKTFADFGATGPMVRTLLLKDRYFVGHKFRCGGIQAVVPVGSDEIAFYDQGGTLLMTVSIAAQDEQKAA
jgi:hypothetical protein